MVVTETDDALVRQLLGCARRSARKHGFDVNDPCYGSAVGYAVVLAIRSWDGRSPIEAWTAKLAVQECRRELRERLRFPGRLCWDPPVLQRGEAPDLPLGAFDVLEMVAALGRCRAARILCVTPALLREALDEFGRDLLWGSSDR